MILMQYQINIKVCPSKNVKSLQKGKPFHINTKSIKASMKSVSGRKEMPDSKKVCPSKPRVTTPGNDSGAKPENAFKHSKHLLKKSFPRYTASDWRICEKKQF